MKNRILGGRGSSNSAQRCCLLVSAPSSLFILDVQPSRRNQPLLSLATTYLEQMILQNQMIDGKLLWLSCWQCEKREPSVVPHRCREIRNMTGGKRTSEAQIILYLQWYRQVSSIISPTTNLMEIFALVHSRTRSFSCSHQSHFSSKVPVSSEKSNFRGIQLRIQLHHHHDGSHSHESSFPVSPIVTGSRTNAHSQSTSFCPKKDQDRIQSQ